MISYRGDNGTKVIIFPESASRNPESGNRGSETEGVQISSNHPKIAKIVEIKRSILFVSPTKKA